MELRRLFNDDDAVSPVIGVILMVAITVILAAVIATFVLGLGEQVSDSAPQANFDYELNETFNDRGDSWGSNYSNTPGTAGPTDGNLTVRHTGGQTLQADQVYISGSSAYDVRKQWSNTSTSPEEITSGDSVTIGVNTTDSIDILWENSQATNSATLSEWEGPDA